MDKNKKILLKFILAILSVCIAVFIAISILINSLTYSIVEKIVKKITGLQIEFVMPKTIISPCLNIKLTAKEINLYDKSKKIKFVSINNPDVSIKPFSFVFKRINLKKANADAIKINIKRNSKGEIDLLKELSLKNNLKLQDFMLSRLCGNIKNFELVFDDEFEQKTKTTLFLKNTDIKISKKRNIFVVSSKGTIENSNSFDKNLSTVDIYIKSPYLLNNLNDANFDISVDNFNLNLLNTYLKKYISKEIQDFNGNLYLSLKTGGDNIHKFKAVIKNPVMIYDSKNINLFKNEVIVSSDFSYDKNLKMDNFEISGDNLYIGASGEIIKPLSKKPDISLEMAIKNTQLNNLFYLLPDDLIFYRPKGIPTLKKSNFYGIADGNINLKLFPLDITGNLKVSNIYIPGYPKPYRQNDVNAIFMKDKARIYTRVYTPDNEYVTIDGVSNLDDSLWGKYSIKSTPKIDLAFAKMYLVPIQQIIGFNIGPVPIMNISGYGNIDIKTQGTIKDAQIFGEFNAYNAFAEIEGLDVQLKNGTCKLAFDNRNLIFKEIKGKAKDGNFLLTGIGNTKGEVDLKAQIRDSSLHNILQIFNNSLMTKQYTIFTNNISAVSGKLDTEINLKGVIKDYEDASFLSELDLSGLLKFNKIKIILKNKLKFEDINGTLEFGQQQKGIINLAINNSKINVAVESKDALKRIVSGDNFYIKTDIASNQIRFSDILNEIKKMPNIKNIPLQAENVDFVAKLNLKSSGAVNIKTGDYSNLKHSGFLIGLNGHSNKNIHFDSGLLKFDNNKIIFNNFIASILGGKLKVKGDISKFLTKTPSLNLDIFLENSNLKDVSFTKIKLSQTKIKNAHIELKNNDIKFNPISIEYQGMPLFLNGSLKDIYGSRSIEANFSTIVNEATSDGIINRFLTYPVKIKGEVPIKGFFKGKSDNYNLDFSAVFPVDSDIFFTGANIGDENLKREITGKINVNGNIAELNNLRLIKYISNQNGKINPVTSLKASGKVVQKENKLFYDNLRISTSSPATVRILNLLFKKSILKKGNIECNINLKGDMLMPKINGRAYLQDLDIPLYNTMIDNIKLYMTDDYINGEIFAKNNESDLKVSVKAQNKQNTPYIVEHINILSNKLDIAEILNSISISPSKTDIDVKQGISFKPEDIIVKKGDFNFKDVVFEKIKAENMHGNFDYKNNMFNLKNILFNIAEGKINANGKYDTRTKELKLKAGMENCNSSILTEDFLHMKGQLYGKINGSIDLETKNLTGIQAIKNIKSDVSFVIENGKMPKLGSLEYLLRAGNLIRNGIFGLSLNNIIQVLTPYKTGEFEVISGSVKINKGEVEKLSVTSKSKNLSMYLEGTYSILDAFADINIYGKLSQNISNALGAVGNASVSQFINSITSKKSNINEELKEKIDNIPSIEIENPEPKYFKVKVFGDINKDNYIKNFSWI